MSAWIPSGCFKKNSRINGARGYDGSYPVMVIMVVMLVAITRDGEDVKLVAINNLCKKQIEFG